MLCKASLQNGLEAISPGFTFIDILAIRFNCQAHPIYWTVNPAKTVAYSAYLIMPKIVGVVDFKKAL